MADDEYDRTEGQLASTWRQWDRDDKDLQVKRLLDKLPTNSPRYEAAHRKKLADEGKILDLKDRRDEISRSRGGVSANRKRTQRDEKRSR